MPIEAEGLPLPEVLTRCKVMAGELVAGLAAKVRSLAESTALNTSLTATLESVKAELSRSQQTLLTVQKVRAFLCVHSSGLSLLMPPILLGAEL